MRGAARDPAIYHPGPVLYYLGRQRRQRKSKTPKTLLNQAPPTVAGLFSCPGAEPAPWAFCASRRGRSPGLIPAADRDHPGGSWRQNDRPPGRGRRSKFCGGQIFPSVKILPCGQNIVGSGVRFSGYYHVPGPRTHPRHHPAGPAHPWHRP